MKSHDYPKCEFSTEIPDPKKVSDEVNNVIRN